MISKSEQYPAQNLSPETGTHFNNGDQIDLHASELDPVKVAQKNLAAVISLDAYRARRAERPADTEVTPVESLGRVGAALVAFREAEIRPDEEAA